MADATSVPRTLLEAPLPEMIQRLGLAVAEAQAALDRNSIEVAQSLAETMVTLGGTEYSLLALGFTPLAMVANPYSDDGLFPWASEGRDLSGVELVPIDLDGPSIERLAALEPDLVLATTASGNEAMYEEVVDYGVPILPPITGPMADSWQDLTRVIARALGVEDLADGVIAEA